MAPGFSPGMVRNLLRSPLGAIHTAAADVHLSSPMLPLSVFGLALATPGPRTRPPPPKARLSQQHLAGIIE